MLISLGWGWGGKYRGVVTRSKNMKGKRPPKNKKEKGKGGKGKKSAC